MAEKEAPALDVKQSAKADRENAYQIRYSKEPEKSERVSR